MSTKVERLADGLRITRIFEAPRERVFEAFIDPDKANLWWGCAQATSVESFIEPRVGGEYRHILQIEDCGKYTSAGRITAISKPGQLAWVVEGSEDIPTTSTEVLFRDLGGRTELILTVIGLTADDLQNIVSDGWTAGLEKLGGLVAGIRENAA